MPSYVHPVRTERRRWDAFEADNVGRSRSISDMRTASCSCGQLTVRCDGEPVRVSMCHCLACKRRSGSAFSMTARWPAERVTIEGDAREYRLVGDEGGTATFRFCATCGATVYFDADRIPRMISVPVGAFADPTFPAPTVSVYGNRRHAWLPAVTPEDLD